MEQNLDLSSPIEKYVRKKLVSVDANESVVSAASIMRQNGIGSLVVVKESDPVGILTERDILYKVVASKKDPEQTKVRSIMSSPIETIESSSKVGDAIAKMSRLGIRRLAVTKDGKLVGLLSQRSIVADVSGEQVLLPELENPKKKRCPYCDEEMKDAKELSKHIDLIHIGKGLLQGNMRKWE
jgi:CBS domain-containing protein